jgi:hypothetical protein
MSAVKKELARCTYATYVKTRFVKYVLGSITMVSHAFTLPDAHFVKGRVCAIDVSGIESVQNLALVRMFWQ